MATASFHNSNMKKSNVIMASWILVAVVLVRAVWSLEGILGGCGESEVFDPKLLRCRPCSIHPQQTENQVAHATGLECECKAGHYLVNWTRTGELNCLPCPENMASSMDGLSCVKCSSSTPYSNVTRTCERCSAGSIPADREVDGSTKEYTCIPCAPGNQPHITGTRCIPCSDPLLVGKKSCDCASYSSSGREMVGGFCFEKSDVVDIPDHSSFYRLEYESVGEEVESAFFCKHARASIALCQNYANATACQCLANLCTMLHFKRRGTDTNDACAKYTKIKGGAGLVGGGGGGGGVAAQKPSILPWIYYDEEKTEDVLQKKDVEATYHLKKQHGRGNQVENSRLNFTVAKYSSEGVFLGIEPVDGAALQLCEAPFSVLDSAFNFGTRYNYKCTIPVRRFWDSLDTVFYDPFLSYEVGGHPVFYPVPVLVLNYEENGVQVNRNPDATQWKLARRFYLVDNVSGRTPCGTSHKGQRAAVVQFAKKVMISIELYRSSREASRIFPPLLSIDYGEVASDDYEADEKVEVEFEVFYKMDLSKEEKDFSIAIGVLSTMAIVLSSIQTWSWAKRTGRIGVDLLALLKMVAFFCGNVSTVFFAVTFFTCLYIFIFFKNQDVAFVILPSPEQETLFVVFFAIAFFLKLVHVIHVLYVQVTCDVFFVDWEHPPPRKGFFVPLKDGKEKTEPESVEEPVSIWRTYLVANEWAEMQAERRSCLGLQVLCSLLLLKVLGFENLASADPESSFGNEVNGHSLKDVHVGHPDSLTCRMALGMGIYLAVAIVQWAIISFIYEPFFVDKIRQFVDLCSVSNVSVFAMSHRQFGYYIHGRSVHGRADTDMRAMHKQLEREQENLCSQRGLMANSDQQTFQMALPVQLRTYYDHIMTSLVQTSSSASRGLLARSTLATGGGANEPLPSAMERNVQAYHTMNKFLTAFLEHALHNLDYNIKERLFVETLLDIEFQEPTDRGFFYEDNGHSYDGALLRGHEFTLILFDTLLFGCVDLLAANFVLAGIIVYLVGKVIMFVYSFAARKNLAKKSLVDARFLI